MTQTTLEFPAFWETMNLVLKDKGLPEMLYDEARPYWLIAQERQAHDNEESLRRRIRAI